MWIKAGTVEPDVRTFQVTGLYEGSDYIFRVYAVNKIGQSKEAAESDRPCRAKMPFGKICLSLVYQPFVN